MKQAALLLATASLALAGCSLGGKAPAVLLTLTPQSTLPAAADTAASAATAIAIGKPVVPQSLDTTRIPVTTSATDLAYLKDAYWVDTPDSLFRSLLIETVGARTGRTVIDPVQVTFDVNTLLNGQLLNFGLDAQRMEAVVTFDASLSKNAGQIVTRRFEVRVPVAVADRQSVAPALNDAANQVATQVADWIGR